ncbi:hypothetical protein [Nonlabens xiamenensis]|uniref:hypothetical protein n=1 Tax=Nonlabens xiamenensis TaxID=2341043 RepID=UPI000F6068CB|nr:hypothetical protein [Nonlabens xiamenensis]
MRKSVLTPAKEIGRELDKISGFVDGFQRRDHATSDQWIEWLRHMEDQLRQYGYAESAELAGFRASIIDGQQEMAKKSGSRSKRKRLAALATVQPVQQLLTDRYRELEAKIESVRSMIKQILVPAREAGMIRHQPGMEFTAFIESLLQQFQRHEQLAPSIQSAIASLGRQDVIRIIAEEIEF